MVSAVHPGLDEAEFVNNVGRHLKRGEFLLLTIGDGIRDDVKRIVDFVQQHSGLHFKLALVEAALYRDTQDRVILQPRVIARAEIVPRYTFEVGAYDDTTPYAFSNQTELTDIQQENRRFWTAFHDDFSVSDVPVDAPNFSKK